jgi:hypothetical protein
LAGADGDCNEAHQVGEELVVSRYDTVEVSMLAEEALDAIALFVEGLAALRNMYAVGHPDSRMTLLMKIACLIVVVSVDYGGGGL